MSALIARPYVAPDRDMELAHSEYGIKVAVLRVTPEMAQDLLDKAMPNRALKRNNIRRFAKSMAEGRWMLGPVLLFTKNMNLLDGQNRLHAVIQSGVACLFICVMGINPSAFPVIDDRQQRSAADVVQIMGEKNASNTIAALRLVVAFDAGMTAGKLSGEANLFANDEVGELLKRYPDISQSVSLKGVLTKFPRSTTLMGCHYIFSRIDRDMADKFFNKLANGEGMVKGDPVLCLRERLIQDRASRYVKMNKIIIYSFTVKAWNAYREGRPLSFLRWTEDESVPIPA